MTAPVDLERERFVAAWEADLRRGLELSGEDKAYFAHRRIRWLRDRVRALGFRAEQVLDFGCGFGDSCPVLLDQLAAHAVVGVDVSEQVVQAARSRQTTRIRFSRLEERPQTTFDLAYCNGVFHHIPPARRLDSLGYIRDALRPGGLLSFWENNPWNPGTRLVMSRIPFDREAQTLSPPTARRLLRAAGFLVLRTDFLFIFPRALGGLRWLEPMLSRFPIGAQYQVLCQRPA